MTRVNPLSEDEQTAVTMMGALLTGVRQAFLEEDWGGLRPSHFRVIAAVPPAGVTISELAARVGMTKQGCGQFVRQLVETGYLTLERPPADRRQRVVRRSRLGERGLRRAIRRQLALEETWGELVGARRYATFRRVLEDLTRTTG